MSTDRDLTRIVRSWLHEDAHEDAERVLFGVLNELDATPQRAVPWWAARRFFAMNSTMRIALAAAAVVIVAAIGAFALRANQVGPPSTSPTPESSAAALPGLLTFAAFDTETSALYISTMSPDGTARRTAAGRPAWIPRFSPDGTKILLGAYQALWVGDQTDDDVFAAIMNVNGGVYTPLRLAEGYPESLLCTAWLPDGTRLVCGAVDTADPSRTGLYTVRSSDGGDLQKVKTASTEGLYMAGDFSPDGSQIIGTYLPPDERAGTIGFVNADGSGEGGFSTRPMIGLVSFSGAQTIPSPVSLSPDGQTVVAASDGRLYLAGFDGSLPRRIDIPDDPELGTPQAAFASWSPDGDWIVFSLAYPDRDVTWDLYRMHPDGSELTQLTNTPTWLEINADWTGS
jgi:Tol biopolymer transport system component